MNCLGATAEAALFDDFLQFCCDSGRKVREAVSRLRSKGQGVGLIGCGRDSIFKVLELNGGKLEIAQQIADHESARTTGLYD